MTSDKTRNFFLQKRSSRFKNIERKNLPVESVRVESVHVEDNASDLPSKEENNSAKDVSVEGSAFDSINMSLTQESQYSSKLPSLDKSIHLEEAKPPHRSSLNIFIITSILGGFIFWASVTPIDEVAVAAGQIIPSGFIKSVQHLEGGIVAALYVKEGQWVNQGDLLIRLDGMGALSDLQQALSKQRSLRIKVERLRAIGLSRQPNFNKYGSPSDQLIEDQKAIYNMQLRNLNDQKTIVQKQIQQQREQLTTQVGQERDIQNRLQVVEKQRDIVKNLYETRLKTGTEYRHTEETVMLVEKELNEVVSQMQKTKEGIIESENRLIELDTRMRSDALKEMGASSAELNEVTETIAKLKDRVSRLDIYAPNSGEVKGLKVTNLRAVIQQGEEIMQIVPDDAIEVEAKLPPKEVGNVRPNQRVTIKVEAYDYARYGAITGTLRSVSASTFLNEERRPYYKAFIDLDQYYVGSDNTKNPISPGMTVTADIHTGDKTLLQYLIRPIYNAYKSAFRER